MVSSVWSWAPGQPANRSAACAVSRHGDGRFGAADCNAVFRFACARGANEWVVSAAVGRFRDAACPSGFHFAVPRNGYENSLLHATSGGQDVWVNYADPSGRGDWRA